jgi:hypothetical protein
MDTKEHEWRTGTAEARRGAETFAIIDVSSGYARTLAIIDRIELDGLRGDKRQRRRARRNIGRRCRAMIEAGRSAEG